MTETELFKFIGDALSSLGLEGILIATIVFLITGKFIVPRWIFDIVRQERDDAIAITKQSTNTTEKAVTVAEKHIEKAHD